MLIPKEVLEELKKINPEEVLEVLKTIIPDKDIDITINNLKGHGFTAKSITIKITDKIEITEKEMKDE